MVRERPRPRARRGDHLRAHPRARRRAARPRCSARRSSPPRARASARRRSGQKAYVDAIDENTIVFGIGPAGTGKTYLAMAKAVQALQRKEVERIILTRPAVEAGERLGFLPGTLTDKIDPYLRPLYDALNEMMDPEIVPKLLATGTIEVAPLAYMRGRTLNDSFVVLDEAQNTTPEQMKMFLTRLGFGSQMVVTGDITQVDLPPGASGLRLVTRVLDDIDDIHFSRLTSEDVVRHTPRRPHRRRVHRVRRATQARLEREQAPSSPTGPSARRPQPAGPPRRPAEARHREHRDQQRVRRRGRRGGAAAPRDLRARPAARHPDAELAIVLVDEAAMEQLHVQWMDEPGPTDVLSFPMDELRPGTEDEPTPAGLLGDIVLCPQVAEARPRPPATRTLDELLLLTAHGLLHLLGFDHAEPEEEREMFGIQRDILVGFAVAERRRERRR